MFSDWVTAGGNLIAMRPDKQLAGLLGLTDAATTRANAYLLVNTAAAPGRRHRRRVDAVSRLRPTSTPLNGATTVATLYANARHADRESGRDGAQRRVAAAARRRRSRYDLARSVVYTRQGNPAWAGQERDGTAPIRSDDLFFGGAEPDWVDLTKVAIPQADEQQRLLANLIGFMNADRKPLPRFWYLPTRPEGGCRHDRRRSRQQRNAGSFRRLRCSERTGLQRRRLGSASARPRTSIRRRRSPPRRRPDSTRRVSSSAFT